MPAQSSCHKMTDFLSPSTAIEIIKDDKQGTFLLCLPVGRFFILFFCAGISCSIKMLRGQPYLCYVPCYPYLSFLFFSFFFFF